MKFKPTSMTVLRVMSGQVACFGWAGGTPRYFRVASAEAAAALPRGHEYLPADVTDTIVDALTEALVLDYQQHAHAMVDSPRGRVHDLERHRT